MRYLFLILIGLLLSAPAVADFTTYCNWSVILNEKSPEKSIVRNSSPVGCANQGMVLNPEQAIPPFCPTGYTEFGSVQGGIVGAIGDKFYLLEARRICLKNKN